MLRNSGVQEGRRHQLKYPTVHYGGRYQCQGVEQSPADAWRSGFQQLEEQVDCRVDQDEPLHGLGEGRKT